MDNKKKTDYLKRLLKSKTPEETEAIKKEMIDEALIESLDGNTIESSPELTKTLTVDMDVFNDWQIKNPTKSMQDYVNEIVPKPILPESQPSEEPKPYITVDNKAVTEPPKSMKKLIAYGLITTFGLTALVYVIVSFVH